MLDVTGCSGCSKPIDTRKERFLLKKTRRGEKDKYLCPECLSRARTSLAEQTQNPNMAGALSMGLAGAIVGGIVWYGIVRLTDWQIGIIAVLIGFLVGKGVVIGSGNKRGTSLQVMSLVLTLAAMLTGEYFIFSYFFNQAGFSGNLPIDVFGQAYASYISSGEGLMTIIFYAIALWQAFSTPAARKLKGELVRPEFI